LIWITGFSIIGKKSSPEMDFISACVVAAILISHKDAELPGSGRMGVIGALVLFILPSEIHPRPY